MEGKCPLTAKTERQKELRSISWVLSVISTDAACWPQLPLCPLRLQVQEVNLTKPGRAWKRWLVSGTFRVGTAHRGMSELSPPIAGPLLDGEASFGRQPWKCNSAARGAEHRRVPTTVLSPVAGNSWPEFLSALNEGDASLSAFGD